MGVAIDMEEEAVGREGLNIGRGERVDREDIGDVWVKMFVFSSDPWWDEEEGSEADLRGGGACA
jgi:hypothetical protein